MPSSRSTNNSGGSDSSTNNNNNSSDAGDGVDSDKVALPPPDTIPEGELDERPPEQVAVPDVDQDTHAVLPRAETAVTNPLPKQVAIENVEFIKEDERRKQLEAAVNRHQSQNKWERHKRNSSLRKTPSIDEEKNLTNDENWLKAVKNSGIYNTSWNSQEQPMHPQYQDPSSRGGAHSQQPQQRYYPYPPPQQTQTQQQQQQQQQQPLPPYQSPPPPQPPEVGYPYAYPYAYPPPPPQPNIPEQRGQPYYVPTQAPSTDVQPPHENLPWPAGQDMHHYQEQKRQQQRSHSGSSTLSDESSNGNDGNGQEGGAESPYYQSPQQQQRQSSPQQVHPLKQDRPRDFVQQQQQEQPLPGADSEYAALLPHIFSDANAAPNGTAATSGGDYGAISSSNYSQHQRGGSAPPSGRRIPSDSLMQWPPRKNPNSSSGTTGGPLPPTTRTRTRSSETEGLLPPPPPSHPPPTRHASPPHIHRRSRSENYNQHPLLRHSKYRSSSPRAQYGSIGATHRVPLQAPSSAGAGLGYRKSPSESSAVPPGHRRVKSGSGGGGGLLKSSSTPSHRRARSGSGRYNNSMGGETPRNAPIPGSPVSPTSAFNQTLANRPSGHHRRTSSLASSSGMSVASEASFMSVVSDIRKSAFYGGYDEATGNTQMHYPNENIHLTTNKDLKDGWIYRVPVDPEMYEEYHRAAEDAMIWEDAELDQELHKCGCKCPACFHGCTGHTANKSRKPKDPFTMLPPNTFALAVDDSIYRNILEEISQAYSMPCGLFYCGHHEDVDHPSIMIPASIVLGLLITMGAYAYSIQG